MWRYLMTEEDNKYNFYYHLEIVNNELQWLRDIYVKEKNSKEFDELLMKNMKEQLENLRQELKFNRNRKDILSDLLSASTKENKHLRENSERLQKAYEELSDKHYKLSFFGFLKMKWELWIYG